MNATAEIRKSEVGKSEIRKQINREPAIQDLTAQEVEHVTGGQGIVVTRGLHFTYDIKANKEG
jgi:hypothetical protein